MFAALGIAAFLCFLLASRVSRAPLAIEWSKIALGLIAPLAAGGVCGYMAQRHDLIALLVLGVIGSGVIVVLGAVGDLLGIPRDHIGVPLEIVGVVIYCVPLVVVGGAFGGKLRSGRYA